MQGKQLFLDRAISRTSELQSRLAALATAATTPDSISGSRQIIVAAADAAGIRCEFFTSIGAILDFSASWVELERARTWWYYVRRWHFWVFSDDESRLATEAGFDQTLACLALDRPTDWRDSVAFDALLEFAEGRARRSSGFQLTHVRAALCADGANP